MELLPTRDGEAGYGPGSFPISTYASYSKLFKEKNGIEILVGQAIKTVNMLSESMTQEQIGRPKL